MNQSGNNLNEHLGVIIRPLGTDFNFIEAVLRKLGIRFFTYVTISNKANYNPSVFNSKDKLLVIVFEKASEDAALSLTLPDSVITQLAKTKKPIVIVTNRFETVKSLTKRMRKLRVVDARLKQEDLKLQISDAITSIIR